MTEQIDNWLIGPLTQCVLYLSDEMVYSGLVRRGLSTMTGMIPYFALANNEFVKMGIDTAPLRTLAREYLSWEDQAKEHIDNGFTTVHSHSLIGLWCVVETTVEDSVLLILKRSPVAEKLLVESGYRVRPSPLRGLEEGSLQKVYSSLEKQARDRGNIGEAWIHLLSALDVKFGVDEESIELIAEANEIRNCILHRGSVIDDRAASKAPGLRQLVGQKVEIGEKQYVGYYNALGAFATAMIGGVTSSCHCKWRKTGG